MRLFIKNIVSYLLIIIWGLFIFNSTNNSHTHRLSNGEIITHAHPYSKTKHNHTKKQLDYLHIVHHAQAKTSNAVFVDKCNSFLTLISEIRDYNYTRIGIPIQNYSHSPPSFL